MTREPLRILLLEDDVSLGQVTVDTLDIVGDFEIEHVLDTETALALMDEVRFDFCVLDMNLRNGDSAPVMAKANGQGMPTILTSGGNETSFPSIRSKPAMFLQKPVPFGSWATAIATLLRELASPQRPTI